MSISINTLVLTLDKYPEDFRVTSVVSKLNLMFVIIFAIDLFVQLFAYGFKAFFKGAWFNTFDCIIVIASTVDIVL